MNGFINVNSETLTVLKKYNFNNEYENDIKFTSIILLTYNQLNYTKLCIESIKKFTPKNSYEIIVVDNNSIDGTVDWLKNQTDLNIIYNNENKGFPAGCNQGVSIAKGDNILFLNNDTIVTPQWLDNLNTALYSNDDIGAVGCVSNSCSNLQQINVDYKNINNMLDFAKNFNKSDSTKWDLRVKLIGYCYLVKKSILDKIGVFDERFSPGNYEDDDLSFRLLQNKYKLLLCTDVFIHHFGSVSFKSNPKFTEVFFKNQAKINEKWNFDSSVNSNIRLDLVNIFKENTPQSINVLDVGCGLGSTLLYIKSLYKNANLYGIESNKDLVKLADHLFNITSGDIETMNFPYENKFFDYIILGDILEHLIDPAEFLKKIKTYLKEDGYILACIPNIMNIGVIKNLILGRFKYEDSGLLDKNHLRFFTLTEIDELFKSVDSELDIIAATSVQLSPEDESLINTLCSISNESLRQQYSSYQYILRARNKLNVSISNNSDLKKLKFKLLRLDNDIDVDKSLNEIFDMYKSNTSEFEQIILRVIADNVIAKEKVIKLLYDESKSRNLTNLSSLLEVK